MREIRQSGSEGGEAELNRPSLPLSRIVLLRDYFRAGLLHARLREGRGA
jgi:hypothetical protein